MRLDATLTIARREFRERIRTKGFWFATIGLPLIMVAMTVLPSLFLARSKTHDRLAIVDLTGRLGADLQAMASPPSATAQAAPKPTSNKEENQTGATFDLEIVPPSKNPDAQAKELDQRVLDGELDAWLRIEADALATSKVSYRGRSVSNFMTQEQIESNLTDAFRRVRLRDAGLDLSKLDELLESVDLSTVRVTAEGSRKEGGLAGIGFAYILFLMLFVSVQVWGQQVMSGVLEEKGSRILEVMIATVRPFELLFGKLLGIGSLGLVQMSIWLVTFAVASAPGVLAAVLSLPAEISFPRVTVAMVIHLIALFVLGFFAFASLYAAIGAAFNNLQEAQQVAGMLSFLLVIPVMFAFKVINAPDSTSSVVLSLIPLFTPFLMALRLSIQMPPAWQLLLAYLLTSGFVLFMMWACARIYRVGILMYGKKPTIPEIWKWVRHS